MSQVTHLGYYASELEAAQVHDKVALSMDNHSILNFDASNYSAKEVARLRGCQTRPELQRSLGVKPMDKSSRCVPGLAHGGLMCWHLQHPVVICPAAQLCAQSYASTPWLTLPWASVLTGHICCRFRGVSKKKNKWEAKLMRERKWAFRELFDSEEEAARAYDKAVWRLRPEMALAYVNFPDMAPSEALREAAFKRKHQNTPSR